MRCSLKPAATVPLDWRWNSAVKRRRLKPAATVPLANFVQPKMLHNQTRRIPAVKSDAPPVNTVRIPNTSWNA